LLVLAILWLLFSEKFNRDSKLNYSHNAKTEQITDNSSRQVSDIQREEIKTSIK
jgi:hypothetical protein